MAGDWAGMNSNPFKRLPLHALQSRFLSRSLAAVSLVALVVGHATADVVRAEAVTGSREAAPARAEDLEFF